MTALKAREIERFIVRPDITSGVILLYGPDSGLVRESARRLLQAFAEESEPTTLDATDLDDDPSRLAVEAGTPSLFGGKPLLRVRAASRALVPVLKELLIQKPEAILILEAGNLAKNDPLRQLIEADPLARALPCYADNDGALATLATTTFREAAITVEAGTIELLVSLLGNDREITRRELEKLVLYAAETLTLSREEAIALCGDNAALALDQIVDAAGRGHAQELEQSLARAEAEAINPQRILAVALQHFFWLRGLRVEVDAGRAPRAVLEAARPRPHFSRINALEEQLRLWSDHGLAAACTRLYEAISASRKSSRLDNSIAHRGLLALCVAAAHN